MNESKATVPISGRVGEDDYQFLMGYPIDGKVTASEKLRYVMSFFRSYHESLSDYSDCLSELNRLLEPSRKEIKRTELEAGVSSELIDRLLQVLPEMLALCITADIPKKADKRLPALLKLEERQLKLTMGLIESVLRMGLTQKSPTYNPTVLKDKMKTISELVELSRQT